MTSKSPAAKRSSLAHALLLLRALWQFAAVLAFALWGVMGWPLPLPGLIIAPLALVAGVVLWAAFLSPRPMLGMDYFVTALFELVFYAAAVAALIVSGVPGWLAAIFGLFGAALGYFAPRPAS